MSTYKAVITHLNKHGNTQYHVIHNIIANGVSGATELALDDFYNIFGENEIEKIVIELRQSTRRVTGDLK